MGGWVLEVAKMAIYMSFPVGMFHYFNQPEYFEEWVTRTKREMFPPTNENVRKQIDDCKRAVQEKHDKVLFEQLNKLKK